MLPGNIYPNAVMEKDRHVEAISGNMQTIITNKQYKTLLFILQDGEV